MGGTGKTPLVRWVAEYLFQRDRRVAILLRGYRRPAAGTASAAGDLQLLGDEGAWLKQALRARADVFAACDRKELAREVDVSGRYDVFVLDDGFQHWRLRRDLDIVTVDATRGLGNGFLIPAGPLREEAAALGRAHVVCLTRSDEVAPAHVRALKERIRRIAPAALLVELAVRPTGLVNIRTAAAVSVAALKGRRAGIFCGIGNPGSFRRTCATIGLDIVFEHFFEDHHPYAAKELDRVARQAVDRGATALCTTEKDAARLEGIASSGIEVWAVSLEPVFVSGQEVLCGRLDSLFSV
jgi:tetraacyldisaccharide 4'-kinase